MRTRTRVLRILLKFGLCYGLAFVVVLLAGSHIKSVALGGMFGIVMALIACVIAAIWTEKERYP